MDRDHSHNWNESADNQADDSETTPRPLNIRNQFLEKWLNLGDSSKESNEQEDESETTSSKKKKRFRKVFKRLFPSIASKEEPAEASEKATSFMPPSFELPRTQQNLETTETLHDGDAVTIMHETQKNDQEPSSDDIDPGDHVMEYEDMSEHQPERIAHAKEHTQNENDLEIPLQQARRETNIDPPEYINRQRTFDRHDELDPVTAAAMTPAAAIAAPRTETVGPHVATAIESQNKRARSNALAAFLAADFLSRRRDRKLRRELRTTKKTNEKTTEQIQRTQSQTNRKLEQIMSRPSRLETIQSPPSRAVTTEKITIKPKEVFRAETISGYQHNQDPQKPRIIEKTPEIAVAKHEREPVSKNRYETAMDDMFNQNNTEKEDQTPETFFERRHEVMDEATKRRRVASAPAFSSTHSAASIASVLQNQPRPISVTQTTQSTQHNQPAILQNQKLYKQSIQYGIASAVFIVVFALIAYAAR